MWSVTWLHHVQERVSPAFSDITRTYNCYSHSRFNWLNAGLKLMCSDGHDRVNACFLQVLTFQGNLELTLNEIKLKRTAWESGKRLRGKIWWIVCSCFSALGSVKVLALHGSFLTLTADPTLSFRQRLAGWNFFIFRHPAYYPCNSGSTNVWPCHVFRSFVLYECSCWHMVGMPALPRMPIPWCTCWSTWACVFWTSNMSSTAVVFLLGV